MKIAAQLGEDRVISDPPRPRGPIGLGAPPVGGWPLEHESRRDYHRRMLREKRERQEAQAEAAAEQARRLEEWNAHARRWAPRRSKAQPVVEEARRTWSMSPLS